MGVLWILRTGAPWKDVPRRYPPYQTCHRRYQQWLKSGVMEQILPALAVDLKERGKIDLKETFIDGSFSSAKKGAQISAKLRREKALKSWQLQTLMVCLTP
jgi:transposase